MKYMFLIIISCGLLFGSISCKKDFLDVPDRSVLLRQVYVTDLKTMGEFLNGIYIDLSASIYSGLTVVYPDLVADNLKLVDPNQTFFLFHHYNWNQQPDDVKNASIQFTSNNMNSLWFNGYKVISSCNFIIEEIGKYRSENEGKADDIKGQAIAIRGILHFLLVNVFAQQYSYTNDASHPGIIYKLSSKVTESVSRVSVREIFANIISDFTTAISLLPEIPTTVAGVNKLFVFNKNSAKAFLARAYLYKGDYSAAKNLATEITVKVPLMTGMSYPSKLFTSQESEALFQLPPSRSGVFGGNYNTLFIGYFFAPSSGFSYRFLATSDIVKLLHENTADVRKSWIVQNGANWNVAKFPKNVVPGFPGGGAQSHYYTLIRSSEMYLTAAESFAKLSMDDSARLYINAIRSRAGIGTLNTSTSGSALLDSIYKERRRELAFEGFRMYDLLRWKKGVNRMDAQLPSSVNLAYPSGKAIAPIPVSDVLISGIQQNPSY